MVKKYAATLCVVLLAGCGSLPLPHKDAYTNHPVQVDGARGTLSPQQSKTVLAKLKNGSPKTNIFDRHLAQIEEISGSPLITGNKVTLLVDGPATYKSMFAAIQGAKIISTWKPTVSKMTRLVAGLPLR